MLSMSNVSAAQAENYYESDDYYTAGLTDDNLQAETDNLPVKVDRSCASTSGSTAFTAADLGILYAARIWTSLND